MVTRLSDVLYSYVGRLELLLCALELYMGYGREETVAVV